MNFVLIWHSLPSVSVCSSSIVSNMTTENPLVVFTKFVISYLLAIPILLFLKPYFVIYHLIFDSDLPNRLGLVKPYNRKLHSQKVASVQAQVLTWNRNGRRQFMCTARKAWRSIQTHYLTKTGFTQIEIDLRDIVEIDTENRFIVVEPELPIGKLTEKLVPMGWTVPVVPEFEILTIGGLICGAGIESSSHKYGLFHDICIEYEVVLADGSLVTCSENENSDLFHAVPGSLGTLGFLTSAKLPLIPAGKYVKLEYYPTRTMAETMQHLRNPSTYQNEFVEGIAFSQQEAVMSVGNMVDKVPAGASVNHLNRWYKPFFYQHMKSQLDLRRPQGQDGPVYVDYIPLRDYYHRHTRGGFWLTEIIVPSSTQSLFRALFGYLFPLDYQLLKRIMPRMFYEMYIINNNIVQDFGIDMSKVEETIKFCHDVVEVYPLWLCPATLFAKPGLTRNKKDQLILDLGVYGLTPKTKEYDPERTTRQLEKRIVLEDGGYQAPYADIYLTREENEKMVDLTLYNKVRERLGCKDAFPDLYDKYCRKARNY